MICCVFDSAKRDVFSQRMVKITCCMQG